MRNEILYEIPTDILTEIILLENRILGEMADGSICTK